MTNFNRPRTRLQTSTLTGCGAGQTDDGWFVPLAAIDIKTIGDARAPPTGCGLRGMASEDQPTL